MTEEMENDTKENPPDEQQPEPPRPERPRSAAARRRRVAQLLAGGKTLAEIAAALRSNEATIRRDIRALRRAAAEREPWGDPAGCNAAFIEAAENALQKIRGAQGEVKAGSTAYHNLVKLEWQVLIKFIDMTTRAVKPTSESTLGEDEDLSGYTNEELLQKARELGIDVTGFEQALCPAQPAAGPETQPYDGDPDAAARPDEVDEAA